jgi:chaperonin GroES
MDKELMIVPLSNRLILKAIEEKDHTQGGLHLHHAYKVETLQGLVLAKGPGKELINGKREDIEVSVGDVVIFARNSGMDIELGRSKYKLITADDLLGVIE